MKTDLQKLEDVVLDLENEAENANYHELCSMYRKLAKILCEQVDDFTALKIMKAVQKSDGFIP